jgi:hypothetical protein
LSAAIDAEPLRADATVSAKGAGDRPAAGTPATVRLNVRVEK